VRLDDLPVWNAGAVSCVFGGNADVSGALPALVCAGRKRASCLSMAEGSAGEALPGIGRCDIGLTRGGQPAQATRTVKLRLVRFCDRTGEMALAEGEDETQAGWQAGHGACCRRRGSVAPDMGLIRERFDLVEDLAQASDRGDTDV